MDTTASFDEIVDAAADAAARPPAQYPPSSLLGQIERAAIALDDVSAQHARAVREGIVSLHTVTVDRNNRMAQVSEQAARALDLREQITTMQQVLDATRARQTELRQQIGERDDRFAKFGDTVRAAIIQAGEQNEWDDEHVNGLLVELGMDAKREPRIEFTILVTTRRVVRARPVRRMESATDGEFIEQSIYECSPHRFEMDDDWTDVAVISDEEADETRVQHVRTVPPAEDE